MSVTCTALNLHASHNFIFHLIGGSPAASRGKKFAFSCIQNNKVGHDKVREGGTEITNLYCASLKTNIRNISKCFLNESCAAVFLFSISKCCTSGKENVRFSLVMLIGYSSLDLRQLDAIRAPIPHPPLNLFIPLFQLLQCCVVGNTAIALGKENVFREQARSSS